MKYVTNLLRSLSTSIVSLRYYNSVDNLPIEIWFKIHEDGDLRRLIRNDVYFKMVFYFAIIPLVYIHWALALVWIIIGLLIKENPVKTWTKIYDEYLEKIKPSKEFTDYLNQIKQIALLQCEWIIEPSPINKANVLIEKAKLEEKTSQKRVEYNELIASLSKLQGYRIDPKVISVREFYSYLKLHNNGRG